MLHASRFSKFKHSTNNISYFEHTGSCYLYVQITEYVLHSCGKNHPNTWRCIINSSNPCLAHRHTSDGLAA